MFPSCSCYLLLATCYLLAARGDAIAMQHPGGLISLFKAPVHSLLTNTKVPALAAYM
jgi:hypothetical protein